jgi:formate dehydrogenase subunit delta
MTVPTQVRLANDIAAQFHHLPPDRAAAAVADHMTAFWDPRMRRALRELVEQGAEQDRLDPIAAAAAKLLQPV